jgi:hypothetical protein
MKHNISDITKINLDLKRTNKLLIAIGDSFTYGSSAWDDELINLYPPTYQNHNITYNHYDVKIKKVICDLYPNEIVLDSDGNFDFSIMFQNNSYVNVLGKLLNDEWTVANLGVPARGNFSAISNLFMVGIDWHLANEITLIYMPSSMNRIDVLNDGFVPHKFSSLQDLFHTAWPSPSGGRDFRNSNDELIKTHGDNQTPWNRLQDSLYDSIYSKKYEVLKTILEFQHLNVWVKLHKARLIVIPAFSDYYYPEYFSKQIKKGIKRDYPSREFIELIDNDYSQIENYVEYIPWVNVYHPHNFHSFYHYSLSQVENDSNNVDMFSLIGKPTKDNWIMSCGHPSAKSHRLMAKYISTLIKKPLI